MNEVIEDDHFRNTSPEVMPRRTDTERFPEVMPRRREGVYSPETASRDDLVDFVGRLSTLGATLDQIEDVKAKWATWDEDLAPGELSRHDLVRLDDGALSKALADARAEYVEHTSTEDEQAAAEHRAAVQDMLNEAYLVVANSNVPGVLYWVGNDPVKANAIWIAEQTLPDHAARKGVLDPLVVGFDLSVPAS